MNQNIVYLLFLLFAITACKQEKSYSPWLIQVDSQMKTNPEEALSLLQDNARNSLQTSADQAYYALLLTQARDKNYIVQTNDSLIQKAVHYYDTHEDAAMQARAYYLWGSVCRDQNKQAEAVEKYLQAVSFAKGTGNRALLGRIYGNIGYIYYLQNLYEKADSLYRQVEQIGTQLKDTSLLVSSLTMQGKILLYQSCYSQAEKKLLLALLISAGLEQNEIKAGIHSALTTLYVRTEKHLKALQHAKQNFLLHKDTLHCYRTFLELGDAYYQAGKLDSATLYIKKSLASSSPATKANAYMRLADIAKAQGEFELYHNMEQLHTAYEESSNLSQQRTGIIKAEQTIELQHRQIRYEYNLQEYRYYILLLIFISMAGIYLLHKRYLKKFHKQKQKALLKEDELHRQYFLLKGEAEQKEKQIAVLQQEIAQHHLEEAQKEQMQKELDELNRQHILLLKKTLQYSEVYTKMKRIISDYQKRGNSKESLTDEEWSRFMAETDKKGILLKVVAKYQLNDREIYYCYLLLADFSIQERLLVLQISRATLYRMEQQICEKMCTAYQANKLQKMLKSIIREGTSNS